MANDPIMQRKSSYIYTKLTEIGVPHVYIDPPENLIMAETGCILNC